MDPAQILPAELVGRCFQIGYNSDSFAASPMLGVCRHWRRLAIDSPLYWRELSVRLDGPHNKKQAWIHTLSARLGNSSPEHPVSLRISNAESNDISAATRQVLSLVRAHMSRIAHLEMDGMPFSVISEARTTFLEGAPLLETFGLGFSPRYSGGNMVVPDFTLWPDMFSGNAPRLHQIGFTNVRIRTSDPWPLGRQIKSLLWSEEVDLLPDDLDDAVPAPLSLFPNLQELYVNRFGAMPDPLPSLSLIRDFTAGGHVASNAARWAAFAPVMSVTVQNPAETVAKEVLDHLWQDYPGDVDNPSASRQFSLQLGRYRPEVHMRIIVKETGGRRFRQRTREFWYEPPWDYVEFGVREVAPIPSSPEVILANKRLTNAVVSLSLQLKKLQVFVNTVMIMPRLESVVVDLPYGLSRTDLAEYLPEGLRIQCPDLFRVAVQGWVDESSVAAPKDDIRQRIADIFSIDAQAIVFS